MSILRQSTSEQGVEIDDEVLDYVARNVRNNVRQLEGALTKILAVAQLNNLTIDIPPSPTHSRRHAWPGASGTLDRLHCRCSLLVYRHPNTRAQRTLTPPADCIRATCRHVILPSNSPESRLHPLDGSSEGETTPPSYTPFEASSQQIGYDNEVKKTVSDIKRKLQARG